MINGMSQHILGIYEDGVIKPLEPLNLPEHQRVRVSVAADTGADEIPGDENGSFFEAASRLGYLGCLKNTPPDLSTNKQYMEGFGTSGT
jgi:predicted DNA-binding antitoxin AbrB/MazE fold protein